MAHLLNKSYYTFYGFDFNVLSTPLIIFTILDKLFTMGNDSDRIIDLLCSAHPHGHVTIP